MTPKSRWFSLSMVLACAAVLSAQTPPTEPENPAVKEFTQKVDLALKALEAPKSHLQEPRYGDEDHAAVSKALVDLTGLIDPIKTRAPEFSTAVNEAAAEEASFWSSAPGLAARPDQ